MERSVPSLEVGRDFATRGRRDADCEIELEREILDETETEELNNTKQRNRRRTAERLDTHEHTNLNCRSIEVSGGFKLEGGRSSLSSHFAGFDESLRVLERRGSLWLQMGGREVSRASREPHGGMLKLTLCTEGQFSPHEARFHLQC